MASHTREQREFIVRHLAMMYSPLAIAQRFALRYKDTSCSEADVAATDPRVSVVDPDLHRVFTEARAAFESDPTLPATAQRSIRLRLLERLYEEFTSTRRLIEATKILEQIAKEAAVSDAPGEGPCKPESGAITWQIVDP
jgi:hypothetical protein